MQLWQNHHLSDGSIIQNIRWNFIDDLIFNLWLSISLSVVIATHDIIAPKKMDRFQENFLKA